MRGEPDKWREPISRALWQPDLFMEVPRWTVYICYPPLVISAVKTGSIYPIWAMGIMYVLSIALTIYDPEWTQTIWDVITVSDEIEP